MDSDDDIMEIDVIEPLAKRTEFDSEKERANKIDGIPMNFDASCDSFSFDVSIAAPAVSVRRSFSQPVLSTLSPSPRKQTRGPRTDLNLDSCKSPKKKTRTLEVQHEFFGVYCLISRSTLPCYKNRCYIGYTVDPNRRIRQHNGGRQKGGAKKTDNRGPWDMVCIVQGFPNSVAALRFEWAWQNPEKSLAIKDMRLKKARKETCFAFRLRVCCHLLNSQPWCRFGLAFRWLIASEELPFPTECSPPAHMLKRFGLVEKISTTISESFKEEYLHMGACELCKKRIEKLSGMVRCVYESCKTSFHMRCLAEHALNEQGLHHNEVYPLRARCPKCCRSALWGEIIALHRTLVKAKEALEQVPTSYAATQA